MAPEARLRVELPNAGATHGTATAPRRSADSPVEQAVSRSVKWMLSAQSQEGYWWGELEADTTLESDYILYLHILGELESPKNREAREVYPRPAASRWRLEYFLRRSCGAERDRKGLGRASSGR